MGSDNLSVKKNAAIYSGLGLDGSPTSSLGDSPMESEGLSCRLSFDGFESPTRILQVSSWVFLLLALNWVFFLLALIDLSYCY